MGADPMSSDGRRVSRPEFERKRIERVLRGGRTLFKRSLEVGVAWAWQQRRARGTGSLQRLAALTGALLIAAWVTLRAAVGSGSGAAVGVSDELAAARRLQAAER
jgi:hypothetical protein